jgi:hypothetical protein
MPESHSNVVVVTEAGKNIGKAITDERAGKGA